MIRWDFWHQSFVHIAVLIFFGIKNTKKNFELSKKSLFFAIFSSILVKQKMAKFLPCLGCGMNEANVNDSRKSHFSWKIIKS